MSTEHGHVSTRNIDALIDAERDGRVYAHGFRGRIGQHGSTAAAEAFARRRYDVWELDRLFVECALDGKGRGIANVYVDGDVVQHRLNFAPDSAAYLLTCRAEEPSSPMRFRFEAAS